MEGNSKEREIDRQKQRDRETKIETEKDIKYFLPVTKQKDSPRVRITMKKPSNSLSPN